ncbi:hypothetical protein JG687_00011696 [Phytophthora cactorum]|uniref:TATA box binding protein associated factor (TAF) histone-like fold domain-containing protein n=1 Tax=Phytophthora cactorum TaxID=29920 RepID=A0A8T1U7M9_9STRA|nr:hypothetical protein JG687_00011696 [Phytophthora cactorum]
MNESGADVVKTKIEARDGFIPFLMKRGHSYISNQSIRRLAGRAGVKRMSALIYQRTRAVLNVFVRNLAQDALKYTEHANRKTMSTMDVIYALKHQGRTLYGFGA